MEINFPKKEMIMLKTSREKQKNLEQHENKIYLTKF